MIFKCWFLVTRSGDGACWQGRCVPGVLGFIGCFCGCCSTLAVEVDAGASLTLPTVVAVN